LLGRLSLHLSLATPPEYAANCSPNNKEKLMTKKDYQLIAQAIADTWCDAAAQLAIAENIAKALADTNPLFDRDRFLAMCGVA
jgi:hypothetical protein